MAKVVSARPEWLKADVVWDVYSVANCMSHDFCDYIPLWKHNGYWLFDSPDVIREVAKAAAGDLSNTALFYYEVYEQQFDERTNKWLAFEPDSSFATCVVVPDGKHLMGYDVVTFLAQTNAEHSPLSCNGLAESISVNQHCLLDYFDDAKRLIEGEAFEKSEPGPYRIFAVYLCDAA